MPRKLQRSLQEYLSKMKNPTPPLQFPPSSFSSSKNWILSGCRHLKTLSFAVDRTDNNQSHEGNSNGNKDEAATLSDIDRFLFENFKSLYVNEYDNNEGGNTVEGDGDSGRDVMFESPRLVDPPKSNLRGSSRFFVGPGLSSSLIEEARLSLTSNRTITTTSHDDMVAGSSVSSSSFSSSSGNNNNDNNDEIIKDVALPKDCIAVLAYSPSPYEDFRRSMQEMVEAKVQRDGKVNWDFIEELLLCYLDLNDNKSHKYILSAFVDLIIALRGNAGRVPARSRRSYHPRSARERSLRRREGI